ncbi:MAG: tryptophan 7-halogenase [Bacteroidia bacterium]
MQTDFDVAIIGGGPGGSSAATYLSKSGYKVVVFEKARFPRDHVGESLIPYCYYKMKEMGVLEEVLKFATKKPGVQFVDRDQKRQSVWCFDKVIDDGAQMSFHTLRAPFDKALLDNSKKCGATVLEEHLVKDADLSDPEKVTLKVINESAEEINYTARFLIDASGPGAFLAKKHNDRTPYEGLDRVALFSHWLNTNYDAPLSGGLIKIIYLGGQKKGWLWVIPVGRNHLSIGVTLNNSYVKEQKKKFTGSDWKEQLYKQEVSEAVNLRPVLKDAELEHEVQMVGDYSYFVKKKFGSNYAMVGDSGAFLDPIFSSGIYVAMETAHRVSKSIDIQFRSSTAAGQKAFEEHFEAIDGGYALIEKFVRLFYDPELLNFSHIDNEEDGYSKFLNAYEIFHYLLAGDFFSDYKKYSDFIDDLNKERNFNHFIHYVKSRANEFPNSDFCKYSYEEVYGHLPQGQQVAPGLRSEKI